MKTNKFHVFEQEQLKLKTLRQAIAQGDADFSEGRSKNYAYGELARELKDGLAKCSQRQPRQPQSGSTPLTCLE